MHLHEDAYACLSFHLITGPCLRSPHTYDIPLPLHCRRLHGFCRIAMLRWQEHVKVFCMRLSVGVRLATRVKMQQTRSAMYAFRRFVQQKVACRLLSARQALARAFLALLRFSRSPTRWAIMTGGKGLGTLRWTSLWGGRGLLMRVISRLHDRLQSKELISLLQEWYHVTGERRNRRLLAWDSAAKTEWRRSVIVMVSWQIQKRYEQRRILAAQRRALRRVLGRTLTSWSKTTQKKDRMGTTFKHERKLQVWPAPLLSVHHSSVSC